ncbi:universal stress protein [Sporosarcina sp. P37]|uniref:universal stress protein n=1 Tax=unclassified Sporosarcina TaxID=2647733 RepID=UPI0009C08928|nr:MULTISPECIES: universal stress protein [unclassified Sporosarcina]ARD47900.1 universal stress protein [Sporosarcina sp. P33]ARK24430.1 universal stress protein [Sporosarcina sp. P37]PID17595.1 universal stress protein [Sporosarcina sp. P35]
MKIAVAIDGSENAVRAAEHAIMLAEYLPRVQLEIIYVQDYSKAKDERLLSQSPESLSLKREQKMHPILALAREAAVDAKVIMLKGNPSQEIINYVNEKKIDKLVIGSRGLNAFQEMVLGSVSHKVMKHVKCPVTIVK